MTRFVFLAILVLALFGLLYALYGVFRRPGARRIMERLAFLAIAVLTLFGLVYALYGVAEEREKPLIIGLVLIFGSGVFATLYLGARRGIE
jgi:drug/metabolite transporter (DMT)-like permease